MKNISCILATVAVLSAFCCCQKNSFDFVDPMIFEGTICIHVGESHFIETNPVREFTWTSSDESVASATNGYLLGKSVGGCIITAKYGNCKRSVNVIVVATDVKYFEMPTSLTVVPGYSSSFEISNCDPEYAQATSITWAFAPTFPNNGHFSFIVSDRTVTVLADETTPLNATARLMGYGYQAPGEEFIRHIDIEVAEFQIILSNNSIQLEVGDSKKLEAFVNPQDVSSNVSWSSSNPDVATFSNDLVTAHSAGSATITASIDGKPMAKCEVTVRAKRVVPDDYKICLYESSENLSGYPYYKLNNRITSLDIVPGGWSQPVYVGAEDGYTIPFDVLTSISGKGYYSISSTGLAPTWSSEYGSGTFVGEAFHVWMEPKFSTGSVSVTAPNGSKASLTVNGKIGTISVIDDGEVGTTTNGGTITVKRPIKEKWGYISPTLRFYLNPGSSFNEEKSYEVRQEMPGRFKMTFPSGISMKNGNVYYVNFTPTTALGTYEFHILDEPTNGQNIDFVVNIKLID